ncbi:ASKHA domain-containing protein [Dethiobacter alkaliphilus]|uniref:ASKHA domain-containing protein n=1 Tax=Dethiobacter alkaliphilus TaxID=427926 RepID=UPI002225CAEB|nr:ASKHA domain-containing protein [Dethiobacter alkaliphilus]MCW3491425.1 ASKHA domain-containing protein [Dethiobacter alkaliphilus]
MDKVTVLFFPDNLVANVEPGTSVLRAATLAGVELKSNCGGDGTCGRCLVKVKDGNVRLKSTGAVSQKAKQAGMVLACQTMVEGNVVIDVPKDSRLDEHQVLLDEKEVLVEQDEGLAEGYAIKPVCRKVKLSLTEPTLTENVSDWNRLQAALRSELDCGEIHIALPVLRELAETLRAGDWDVTVTVAQLNGCAEVVHLAPGHSDRKSFGLAVDIGTTTVVVYLIDLDSGLTLGKKGTYNKQARYGDDVITRMIHASDKKGGLQDLHKAVIDTINQLIDEVLEQSQASGDDVHMAMVAGNSTMTHLFLGLTPKYIRLEPYIPLAAETPPVRAEELGLNINPTAFVATFASVASYVGGDIVSGTLVTNMAQSDEITLFIDIGTNGEMVLGNRDWLMTAACSAGPAFEGGGITFGMRAMKGAIEYVEIDADTYDVKVSTIGKMKPMGICGSGLIDCLAKLREVGIIDRAGKIQTDLDTPRIRQGDDGWEFVLVFGEETECNKDIIITENDIKNLLRAKGAVYAGIRSMLKAVQLDEEVIDKVLIAGGFGNFINIRDAITIGLLPDLPPEKYRFIGNSSVKGARLSLLSQDAYHEAQELGKKMTYLELSVGNDFMDEFMSALFIPHTDMTLFPSVTNVK